MPIHIENLSDEVGRRLRAAEGRIERKRSERDQVRVAEDEARIRLDEAARSKGFWRRLLQMTSDGERAATRRLGQLREDLADIDAQLANLDIEWARLAKGHAGQQVLPDRYRVALSSDWFLYNGVVTEKGEIDHVLGGPTGLWAIEVKNERVLLDIDGDVWQKTRLSQQGRTQETEAATDRTGRNWGREVAEPAKALADDLAGSHPIEVNTAVVIVDPDARVVRVEQPGVDLVTTDLEELDRTISGTESLLDGPTREAIGARIVAHHKASVRAKQARRARRQDEPA